MLRLQKALQHCPVLSIYVLENILEIVVDIEILHTELQIVIILEL